jgi:hypothetical protein
VNWEGAIVIWDNIAQYVPDSMKYKLPEKYRSIPCVYENYREDIKI